MRTHFATIGGSGSSNSLAGGQPFGTMAALGPRFQSDYGQLLHNPVREELPTNPEESARLRQDGNRVVLRVLRKLNTHIGNHTRTARSLKNMVARVEDCWKPPDHGLTHERET